MKFMKKLFLLLLPLLVCCGCCKENVVLTVGSYNVRVPRDKAPNDWKNRCPRVKSILKEHKFDIFGTQEAVAEQIKDIKAAGYDMAGVGREADLGGEYSCVFYNPQRLKCLEQHTFWLSETPDKPGSKSWGTACPRICTYGIFQDKATGRKFVFANTHLDHRSNLAREKGAVLIAHKLLPLYNKYPLILTGDFNSLPASPQIIMLSRIFANAEKAAAKVLPGPEFTYHGYNPANPRLRKQPIDFIFVNKRVKVSTFQVLNDTVGGFHASDHYPLKAVVSL